MPMIRSDRRSASLITPGLGAIVLGIASVVPAAPAAAVEVSRNEILNPLNACQGALPSFEGAIRKRPRGFANEGAQTAFLSCGFPAEAAADKTTNIFVEFRNEGSTTQTTSCTAVDTRNPPKFSTKSISIAAGGTSFLAWSASDNDGVNYRYPAVSCGLAPGMLIQYVDRSYLENVGQ